MLPRLLHAHFRARDLGRVTADEMVHRLRGRQRAHRRQYAERIAGEEDHVGRMAGRYTGSGRCWMNSMGYAPRRVLGDAHSV